MNLKKKLLVTAIIFVIAIVFSTNYFAEEVWKITSLDWQPYSGSDMSSQGNSVQLLKKLLSKEGITLKVEFYPWKRSQQLAKTSDYIGYFPAWPEEVTEGFIASKPVDWSIIAIMKKTNKTIKFTTIDELFKNHKIGLVDYTYPEEITNAMKKYPNNIDISPTEVTLLKKLDKDRVDIGITDPNVMQYLAAQEGIKDIETVKVIMKKELVIALRNDKENKVKIDMINKILGKK